MSSLSSPNWTPACRSPCKRPWAAQSRYQGVCAASQANTLQRQLFYVPSFKIYGSVAGFYDYGPPGCAVKQNITQFWRQHFVLEENMLEARFWTSAFSEPL